MKKKYLMICFHHAYSWFDCNLTDKQKEEFYETWPGLRWMEKSEEEMDNHLNAIGVPALEMWIGEIIEYCAKYNDEWTEKRLKGCKFS